MGSCTNGRLEDLQCAAAILKGKKVAPFVKLIVTPQAARYKEALQTEHLRHLLSRAIVTHPGCDYAVDEQWNSY
ncbi:MAG: aconitase family protein [Lachnospira eligens]